MALSTMLTGGVYWRHWRVTIPAMDDTAAPKPLWRLILESLDYQAPNGDDQILKSMSDFIVGIALKNLSGNIRLFGPVAAGGGGGASLGSQGQILPWIPLTSAGGSPANANGLLFNTATMGTAWTEACTEMLSTTFVCSNANGATRTADLIAYLKRWPHKR